ncbi:MULTISPECIES: hypothetical protein [unclassified Endozoicomonas]|uniref:hypothetical protein n=1 Tax=unclassified Endozoicomonas TaxID=2644528 RepID=UPI003BB7C10A
MRDISTCFTNLPDRCLKMDNLLANMPSRAIAGSRKPSPSQGDDNSFPKPVAAKSIVDIQESGALAAAEMPKQTSDFKITKVDNITKSDCTSFKNRCFRNLLRVLDQKTLLEIISEFSDDDIKFILTLGRYQDNNEHYFNQLKRFDLPDEYHTRGHEEGLKKFNAMHHAESPKLYALFRDTLLAEARGSSRLEDEFGLYFTPSSVWLNPVAEKLRSLNCKRGIEVMGGKGYLSYFLKKYGFRMVVSDNHSNYQHPAAASPPIAVRNENSLDTVVKYQHRSDFLVISWPPLPTYLPALEEYFSQEHVDDYQILRAWGITKPVLFIGERPTHTNNATGSAIFHEHLQTYFDACKIPEYQGRCIGALDEAIIFVPNGKKMTTVEDLQPMMEEACKQQ